MIVLCKSFFFFFFFNEFFFLVLDYDYFDFNVYNFYLIFFLFVLYFNFTLNELPLNFKFDLDLIFKFLVFLFKTPNFFLNYFINTIKKIFLFLFFFKYRQFINVFLIIFKKTLKNFFLLWRPLFKKTSYFGYFRSNRSKWIK